MENKIVLLKEIGEYEGMELWEADVYYNGNTQKGFALVGDEATDWYESDPRELDDITTGLRLSSYIAEF